MFFQLNNAGENLNYALLATAHFAFQAQQRKSEHLKASQEFFKLRSLHLWRKI